MKRSTISDPATTSSRAGLPLALGLVLLSGCAQSPPPPPASPYTEALLEIGSLVRHATEDRGRPPADLADVEKYAVGFPSAVSALRSGDCILCWGAPVEPGGTKVLAYPKSAPGSGGVVLLQDGVTVKKLTALEFQSAPRAGQ